MAVWAARACGAASAATPTCGTSNRVRIALLLTATVILVGCGQTAPQTAASQGAPGPSKPKSIVINTLNAVAGFGPMEGSAANGGWGPLADIHSNGLFTTEPTSRKVIGMLAAKVPSLDDGSISVLPDGRMRVAYTLRG